jgi:hypothetical protein
MKLTEWNAMSAVEKYEYISKTPWVVKEMVGINAASKVNDGEGGSIYYRVYAGDVVISNDFKNQQHAISQALEVYGSYKSDAEFKTVDSGEVIQ